MANKIIQLKDGNDNLYPMAYAKRDLLWTNSSPTTAYSYGDISVNLSDYDDAEIVFYKKGAIKVKVGEDGQGICGMDGRQGAVQRRFTVSTTKVHFEQANIQSVGYFNSELVPHRIYGIKYFNVGGNT